MVGVRSLCKISDVLCQELPNRGKKYEQFITDGAQGVLCDPIYCTRQILDLANSKHDRISPKIFLHLWMICR